MYVLVGTYFAVGKSENIARIDSKLASLNSSFRFDERKVINCNSLLSSVVQFET